MRTKADGDGRGGGASRPDPDSAVPAGRADRRPIGTCAQTADAVLVAVEHRVTHAFQRVPHADSIVSVAGEQNSTANTEVHSVHGE